MLIELNDTYNCESEFTILRRVIDKACYERHFDVNSANGQYLATLIIKHFLDGMTCEKTLTERYVVADPEITNDISICESAFETHASQQLSLLR